MGCQESQEELVVVDDVPDPANFSSMGYTSGLAQRERGNQMSTAGDSWRGRLNRQYVRAGEADGVHFSPNAGNADRALSPQKLRLNELQYLNEQLLQTPKNERAALKAEIAKKEAEIAQDTRSRSAPPARPAPGAGAEQQPKPRMSAAQWFKKRLGESPKPAPQLNEKA